METLPAVYRFYKFLRKSHRVSFLIITLFVDALLCYRADNFKPLSAYILHYTSTSLLNIPRKPSFHMVSLVQGAVATSGFSCAFHIPPSSSEGKLLAPAHQYTGHTSLRFETLTVKPTYCQPVDIQQILL